MQVPRPQLKLRRPEINIHPQTQYIILGITIPGLLLWMAHWLIFNLSNRITFLFDNKESIESVFPEFKFSDFFNNVVFKLNENQGLVYVILGFLLAAFAITLGAWMLRRYEIDKLEISKVRVQSIVVGILISLLIVAAVAAVLNQAFVFYFPEQVSDIVWG